MSFHFVFISFCISIQRQKKSNKFWLYPISTTKANWTDLIIPDYINSLLPANHASQPASVELIAAQKSKAKLVALSIRHHVSGVPINRSSPRDETRGLATRAFMPCQSTQNHKQLEYEDAVITMIILMMIPLMCISLSILELQIHLLRLTRKLRFRRYQGQRDFRNQ